MITLVSTLLCLVFFSILIRFLHKVWWTPIYVQHFMRSQGIKGPSYKFLHGNNKEIMDMKKNASVSPMELSHDIFSFVEPHIYTWIKLYGKNFLMWGGVKAQLVVTEADLIKEILSNKDGAYGIFKLDGALKKLFGNGLSVLEEGEKWSKIRKLANHAFHGESLKEMVPAMTASVETMLERWRHHEGQEIDVYEEFRHLTSEVISKTAFGSSYLEGMNVFQMLDKLTILGFKNGYKVQIPMVGKLHKSREDIEAAELERSLRKSIIEIIAKREEEVKAGDTESFGSDFLGSLLHIYYDINEQNRISLDDVIDQCKTFYFGGHETTKTSLSWIILLLAINTDWQQKARNEVLELFGQENPNADGIAKLKTLNMIIFETLRLYSPFTTMLRRVKHRVKLGNLILPPNTEIHIPPPALHQSTEIWGEDAHLFKPERFSEGVAKATKKVTDFLPFGFGPRTCVGMNYAYTEAKIVLSMILQHYKFTLSPSYVHSPAPFFAVHPQHGVQVVLHHI